MTMKKLFLFAISMICMHFMSAQGRESRLISSTDCPTPDNFTAEYYYEDGEFGARLAWDRADSDYTLDRFEIYRSVDGENYKMVKRIVNTPSITHYECVDIVDAAGSYYYRIIAFYQNNCESEPTDIQLFVTLVDMEWAGNIEVYPNPTSDKVNIKAEAMRKVSVYNLTGQMVLAKDIDNDEVMIDMSLFGNGMYMVEIITERGNIVRILNVLR